jgi:hypothetical protein
MIKIVGKETKITEGSQMYKNNYFKNFMFYATHEEDFFSKDIKNVLKFVLEMPTEYFFRLLFVR